MITWFHGTVARIEVKNALFGPLELPSKTNLKTNLFSPGFYGFSTGSYGLEKIRKNEFLEMRGFRGYDGFYTVYNGFSTNSKFHPAKKKKNIISHHGKQIWHWDP